MACCAGRGYQEFTKDLVQCDRQERNCWNSGSCTAMAAGHAPLLRTRCVRWESTDLAFLYSFQAPSQLCSPGEPCIELTFQS